MFDKELRGKVWVMAMSVMVLDGRELVELAENGGAQVDRDLAAAVVAFQEVVWDVMEQAGERALGVMGDGAV